MGVPRWGPGLSWVGTRPKSVQYKLARDVLKRRLALPENQTELVDVRCERLPHRFQFTIRDQGSGFAWAR